MNLRAAVRVDERNRPANSCQSAAGVAVTSRLAAARPPSQGPSAAPRRGQITTTMCEGMLTGLVGLPGSLPVHRAGSFARSPWAMARVGRGAGALGARGAKKHRPRLGRGALQNFGGAEFQNQPFR